MPDVRANLIISAKDEATATIQKVAAATSDSTGGLTDLYSAVRLAEMGFQALKGAYDAVIVPAAEEQRILAQTAAVLKSTGDASGYNVTQIVNMTDAMAKANGVNDLALQQGANMLLTFRQIGHDAFPQALQAAQDLSIAMGQDLRSSIIQVGKALDDPARGLTALRRIGVTFSEDQANVIKAMVKTGDVAGAQAAILKELNTEFGGSGAANAKTYTGQIELLNNAIDKLKISFGQDLLPLATLVVQRFAEQATVITLFKQAITEGKLSFDDFIYVEKTAAGGAGDLGTAIDFLNRKLGNTHDVMTTANTVVLKIADSLDVQKAKVDQLNDGWSTGFQAPVKSIKQLQDEFGHLTGAQLDLVIAQAQVNDATNKVTDSFDKLSKNIDPTKVDSLTTAWVNSESALDKARDNYDKVANAAQKLIDAQNLLIGQGLATAAMDSSIDSALKSYNTTVKSSQPEIDKLTKQIAGMEAANGKLFTSVVKGSVSQEDYNLAVARAALAQGKYDAALQGTVDKHGKLHIASDLTLEGMRIAAESAANQVDKLSAKMGSSTSGIADYTTALADAKGKLSDLQQQEFDAEQQIANTTGKFILQQLALDMPQLKNQPELLLKMEKALGLVNDTEYNLAMTVLGATKVFDFNKNGIIDAGIEYDSMTKYLADQQTQIVKTTGVVPALTEKISETGGAAHHAMDDINNYSLAIDAIPTNHVTTITTLYGTGGPGYIPQSGGGSSGTGGTGGGYVNPATGPSAPAGHDISSTLAGLPAAIGRSVRDAVQLAR